MLYAYKLFTQYDLKSVIFGKNKYTFTRLSATFVKKSYMLSHSKMEDMQFFFRMKNMRYQRNKDFKSFHLDVFDWLIVECVDRFEAINP